jgi:hypothetical protein
MQNAGRCLPPLPVGIGLASPALARFYSSNFAAPHRTRLKVDRSCYRDYERDRRQGVGAYSPEGSNQQSFSFREGSEMRHAEVARLKSKKSAPQPFASLKETSYAFG